jgi:hypothetical protein
MLTPIQDVSQHPLAVPSGFTWDKSASGFGAEFRQKFDAKCEGLS